MKKALLLPLLLAVLLGATGCSTTESRIREHQDTFARLDSATQEKLRQRKVEVGYTEDMVYIALGVPASKTEQSSEQGTRLVWIYTSTHTEYAGRGVHMRRVLVIDPRTGRRAVIAQPVYTDVYEEVEEEQIRVVFKEGRVVEIETGL